MAGLCTVCGRVYCDHTPAERGQTPEQFKEDMQRDLTPEEEAAWQRSDTKTQIAAAQEIARQRAAGTFVPTF